jgi:dTDP-glucose 4,6-dehydratase
MKTILVTGAAGFIGSAFLRLAREKCYNVIAYDKLTYAGHLANIEEFIDNKNCVFVHDDICNYNVVLDTLKKHKVDAIVHFAAESHVDNSIHGPKDFIETNILGTFQLLEAARFYWSNADDDLKKNFRFLHVSTDEVFGELEATGYFSETSQYAPNSPYSASKASSDHLVRAWHHTYKLPTIITNCSNNYGPRQFPEKLIPRMIESALSASPLPVYGQGLNVRDWIHVEDHVNGLLLTLENGKIGDSYCFGGNSERKNIDVVHSICLILDELKPSRDNKSYKEQIQFVTDRAGHDWRYAIDSSKVENELKYTRKYKKFEDGLRQTIQWYIDNDEWSQTIKERKK